MELTVAGGLPAVPAFPTAGPAAAPADATGRRLPVPGRSAGMATAAVGAPAMA